MTDLEQIVLDPARAGVRIVAEGDARQVAAIAGQHGFAVTRTDLLGCRDAGDARARLAAALDDRAVEGRVLVLAHAAGWREHDPDGFAAVERELLALTERWRERGAPFWVLLPL